MYSLKYSKLLRLSLITGLYLFSGISAQTLSAQESTNGEKTIVYQLFEYPTAPEEIEGLAERSDWLMANFWNGMNLSSNSPVDQNALNHAFQVYCIPMQWASRDAVMEGSRTLLKKIEKNPTLLMQFTKAAEENLYGPRSAIWIDEVYELYLDALVKSKKIDATRKIRYNDQLNIIRRSAIGSNAPLFNYETIDGKQMQYFPMATFTIIEFGDPDCDDCRMGRLAMESNVALTRLIDQGKINIIFMIPDAEEDWKEKVADYPEKWIIGATDNADESYDLRVTPAVYVVNGKGKIIAKNISVREAIDIAVKNLSE